LKEKIAVLYLRASNSIAKYGKAMVARPRKVADDATGQY
jgi:hypothetical protein